MPVGDVLVGDAGGDIKHDDTGLAVDVVTITETTELLLTGGVPHIKLDGTQVLSFRVSRRTRARVRSGARRGIAYGGEGKRVHLDTKGGNVLLLEFTSQVALDEGGLS